MTTLVRVAAAALAVALAAPAAAEPSSPRDLETALRTIVDGSAIRGARAGVLVADVATGEVVYARDADVLLNPASNVKLVTSAAALARHWVRRGRDEEIDRLMAEGDSDVREQCRRARAAGRSR